MGEAKRRGTAVQRTATAIERNQIAEQQRLEQLRSRPVVQPSKLTMAMAAILMTSGMGSVKYDR